jgi:hypothetical protein
MDRMKKIQLNLKKKDRDNLKHMSHTYEDTHMKESSKLENDVNPDVFLMNMQLKNKDNAHLFNMDFSEFLPTVQKKPELESIHEQEPSHLMKDIAFDNNNDDGESFSFLDNLDNIDKISNKIKIETPRETFTTYIDSPMSSKRSYSKQSTQTLNIIKEQEPKKFQNEVHDRSYSKDSISSKRNYSKDSMSNKRNYSKDSMSNKRSYSKQSTQTLNIIKEQEPKTFQNEDFKKNPLKQENNINDFKNQLLKLNSYKTQTLNKYNVNNNNIKLKRPNIYNSQNSNSNNTFEKRNSNTNLHLRINTSHKIPNDPIFKEPLLNNYVRPKISSPKYIPPPKTVLERPLSPARIEFPHEKELREQERMELETQYTQVLPKGSGDYSCNFHRTNSFSTHKNYSNTSSIHMKQYHKSNSQIIEPKLEQIEHKIIQTEPKLTQNEPKLTQNEPKLTQNEPKKSDKRTKLSYKKALYDVLKHKNKINNNTNKKIPKKVLKDLYRFSNKIDINYTV